MTRFSACNQAPFLLALMSGFPLMLSIRVPTGWLQKQSSITFNFPSENSPSWLCSLSSKFFDTIIGPHRSISYIDAACCYRPSSMVCQSICHSSEPCKTTEPTAMPFGLWARVDSRNVLVGGPDPPCEGASFRGKIMHRHARRHSAVSCAKMALTFLVPAYPGCAGKEAVKWVSVCLLRVLSCC